MLQPTTFQFLKNLKKNNNKPWFDANKKQYEAAKQDFEQFITEIIAQFAKLDASYAQLTAKQCMFRINRDVRFSKNKDPYKTNFGASINAGGKKSTNAGFYLHLEPGNCFLGGGIYMPMPDVLAKLRQEVDYSFVDFKKIINSTSFKKNYSKGLLVEDALKNPPKGYNVENPAVEFLKLKSYIAVNKVDDKEYLEKTAVKTVVQYYKAIQPFMQFLNNALA